MKKQTTTEEQNYCLSQMYQIIWVSDFLIFLESRNLKFSSLFKIKTVIIGLQGWANYTYFKQNKKKRGKISKKYESFLEIDSFANSTEFSIK